MPGGKRNLGIPEMPTSADQALEIAASKYNLNPE